MWTEAAVLLGLELASAAPFQAKRQVQADILLYQQIQKLEL